MKFKSTVYIFYITLFIAGLWFAKTLQSQGGHTIALTERDAAKTFTIKKGTLFTLTLPDHIDGGYRFDSIQYSRAVISLQKHTDSPPSSNSAPGQSGTGTWQFITKNAGKTNLKVTATRPWKGGGTVTVFETKITVR